MIRTGNLTKRYFRAEALHGITFNVPESSVFALVGPNGAGKSTAIKIIMNLIEPSEGYAEVLGVDSRRLGNSQLARIGYVSESQRLPQWMRVKDFLDYSKAFYDSWDAELADSLIQQFALPPDRRLRELSRGMRMKTALTVALAHRPSLIVLDEPFTGLDLLVREQLIESLVDCTPDATIFLASHDLAEIESFATHVAYLNEGRLEFAEDMTTLYARFREIDVTLETFGADQVPGGLPPAWLDIEQAGHAVRFIDTNYDPTRSHSEITRLFGAAREIHSRQMSFRSIFLALAKSRRTTVCA